MQKEILGTIYTNVSEDFQRGVCPIGRCVKAEKHDLAVVYAVEEEGMEVRQIGNIMPTTNRDNPNQGRVYDIDALSPSITNVSGGGVDNQ